MNVTFPRLAGVLALAVLAGCSAASAPQAASEAPAEQAMSPAPASAEEDIRHFLLQEFPDAGALQYALAWSDLDGDGANEAIVHVLSPYVCGTGGCNTLVLTQAGPMWRKLGDISVLRTPIMVMDTSSNGWKDLTVAIGGGGGPSGNALLKFDGEAYPGNPTVPPAKLTDAKGTVLIVEEPEFVKLEPEALSGG